MKRALGLCLVVACGAPGTGGDDDNGTPDAAAPAPLGNVVMCAVHAVGDNCMIDTCTTAMPTPASAGTITIAGLAAPITLAPKTDSTYEAYNGMALLFGHGETATITAAGAEVPSFTATVTTPSKATISVPANAMPLAVSRTHDFTAKWSGSSGKLQVALISGMTELWCRFDASAGTGTIPAATMAMLPASPTGSIGFISLAPQTIVAGDWSIDVAADYSAVWPDGSLAGTTAAIQ